MKGKVWTYFSNMELNDELLAGISADTQFFLENWKAHGTPLTATFEIRDRRFLIITVDEQSYAASGCSIDKQVQFIKELQLKYNIELLNRLLVPFQNEAGTIEMVHASKIKELYANKQVNDDTIVFNPAVSNSDELETSFKIPLKESWLKAKV
jgi:hypothetical protein